MTTQANTTMTIEAAYAMLTGPRSISNPALECLGEGDLLALQTLLTAFNAQREALAGLAYYANAKASMGEPLDHGVVARTARAAL